MGWAASYIAKLKLGETVQFRPRGNSMQPRITSGQLCTVEPFVEGAFGPKTGDIVLCKVNGREYLHLVKTVSANRTTFTIGNNKGFINGAIGRNCIYGVCTKVE